MKLKIKPKEIAAVIAIVSITALIMYPMFLHNSSPGWVEDAGHFLRMVGNSLSSYQNDHGGKLPNSIGELYPKYMNDSRVTKSIIEIGEYKKLMVLTYNKPESLGDPEMVVVEPRPNSNGNYRSQNISVVLNADFIVRASRYSSN